MWQQFVYNNCNYLIKFKTRPVTKLYFTDLENIWLEELSEDDLKTRFYSLNKFYAGGDILNEVNTLINELSEDSVVVNLGEVVKFEVSINKGFPLHFCWQLNKQPSNVFFEELTLSLICTVQHLELQQRSLCTLLEKKDKEIQEYKREKGEISRHYLKTDKFDSSSVSKKNDQLLLNELVNKNFMATFTNKYDSATSVQTNVLMPTEPKKRKLKPYVSKMKN